MRQMMNRFNSSNSNQIDELRIVTRLVGMLAVITGLVYLRVVGGETLAVGFEADGLVSPWLLLSALLVAIVGVLFGWRQEGVGGLIAALGGLVLGGLAYFTTVQHRGFSAFAYGSPFLITGLLFLACWWRQARRR